MGERGKGGRERGCELNRECDRVFHLLDGMKEAQQTLQDLFFRSCHLQTPTRKSNLKYIRYLFVL